MLDLDNFKDLNDNHGHIAGDAVLIEVGKVLRKRVRVSDIVGRYGGEEFSIVLISADEGKTLIVAEDIRHSIETLDIKTGEERLSVTISIGVVASTRIDGTLSLERLLTEADRALYRAKREGRNKVCAGPFVPPPPQVYQ
ncbi:MAG: GGDEF domain-containing protein [Spirochaetes bacterium]|nr:GGDEF domain-containing protein [Spirochaetota bacterium]